MKYQITTLILDETGNIEHMIDGFNSRVSANGFYDDMRILYCDSLIGIRMRDERFNLIESHDGPKADLLAEIH